MQHRESRIFPHPCHQVFAVVADIERYPEFLPGWSRVRILRTEADRLEVEQQLRLGPFPARFRSTARLERCRRILITSNDAPFGRMTIEWRFVPRETGGCEVTLAVGLELHPGPLRRPLLGFLKQGGDRLLHHFERRVRELCGDGGG